MDAYQEIMNQIRESRLRMSKECNHDPKTYIANLKSLGTKYAAQLEHHAQRKPGVLRDKIKIADEFDDLPDDMADAFGVKDT